MTRRDSGVLYSILYLGGCGSQKLPCALPSVAVFWKSLSLVQSPRDTGSEVSGVWTVRKASLECLLYVHLWGPAPEPALPWSGGERLGSAVSSSCGTGTFWWVTQATVEGRFDLLQPVV